MTNKWSIQQIKQYLLKETPSKEMLDTLIRDERAGVKLALKQYEKRKANQIAMEQLFIEMSHLEREQWQQGLYHIAGVDEVGRGPLAGPVVAAAVILPENFQLLGLNDSKKLSKKKREDFYNYIVHHSIDYGIGIVEAEEIDRINILQAAKKAMYQAVEQISSKTEHVLIDAVPLDELSIPSQAIIKGDQKSISIAAASVVAKVTRDNMMLELHEKYPAYQFDKNSGYGTKSHLDAIALAGLTPYHRRTFVKNS